MRTGELYQRYYGHYIATVVDVNDPDKLGRIRVQADQFADTVDQPIWASISRPAAGNQQGVFFTPKNGDQVILSFISGDVREPMVMGYSHSTQNAPDTSLVSPKQHGIVTTIGSVVFDEQNGTITVKFPGSQSTMTFDNNGITFEVGGGATRVQLESSGVTITAASLTVTAAEEVAISAGAAMTLDAGAAMTLTATAALAVDAGAAMSIDAGAAMTLTAAAAVDLSAVGPMTLTATPIPVLVLG